MKDFQDIELFVELTPEELEELQGGYALLGPVQALPLGAGVAAANSELQGGYAVLGSGQGFPIGVPVFLSKEIQVVASPVISNSINRGPQPEPWVSLQSLSVNQQGF